MNGWALALSLAAVAAGVTAGMAGLITLLPRWVREHFRTSSTSAVMPLLPAVAGALSVLALAGPNLVGDCHCVQHGLHHPHLCIFHPELSIPLVVPAALLLAFIAAFVAPRLARVARATLESARLARAARGAPIEIVDGVPVRILSLGQPEAFSVGIFRPVIVVDRSLWSALSQDEQQAVAHHEQAHVQRRDGLTLLVLKAFTAFSPWSFGAALVERWKRAAESACDQHAARTVGDPIVVAQALLSVERARARHGYPARTPQLALGVIERCGLEERVASLLADRPQGAPLGSDLLPLIVLAAGAAVLTVAWPGSSFHHAVETMIGLTLR